MTGLYSRLAATGIRKNGKSYIPFILTAALMIAIFYIIFFLSENPMLKKMVGGSGMAMILSIGTVVMGIFSAIFLFYTNSFLIKRRKKEFGLYNILGLGKKQIAKVLVIETVFVYLIAEIAGLGLGILFSKLAEMLASKMLRGNVNYVFRVEFIAVIFSLILFAAIFLVILINSLRQLFFSRPIELLHSESAGEKPPRTNVPAALIGIAALGLAYYMAVTIKNPSVAMGMFFIAVILVIIATYLLFIAGSVVLCRVLQKNKGYYYKTNHFVSVSQMVFRMRKNGAGLASICILSTMVLVTLSSTISLYAGIPDNVNTLYPHDITMIVGYDDETYKAHKLIETADECITGWGYTPKNRSIKHYLNLNVDIFTEVMGLSRASEREDAFIPVDGRFIPIEEADLNIQSLGLELGENDIAIYEPNEKRITASNMLKFGSLELNIIPIETAPDSISEKIYRTEEDFALFYVRDLEALGRLFREQFDILKAINDENDRIVEEAQQKGENVPDLDWVYNDGIKVEYGFDVSEDINEVNDVCEALYNPYGSFNSVLQDMEVGCSINTKASFVDDYYGIYGGLLFLGILLGSVFALSAALIMYYKQISEGFEDAARFEILRKVGMTRREIRAAINSQVLKVFFLPLVAAGIHMLFAFPMIAKMLNMFDFYNVGLFAFVTIIGFVVFGLLYVLFYRITSKSYIGIVGAGKSKDEK